MDSSIKIVYVSSFGQVVRTAWLPPRIVPDMLQHLKNLDILGFETKQVPEGILNEINSYRKHPI